MLIFFLKIAEKCYGIKLLLGQKSLVMFSTFGYVSENKKIKIIKPESNNMGNTIFFRVCVFRVLGGFFL